MVCARVRACIRVYMSVYVCGVGRGDISGNFSKLRGTPGGIVEKQLAHTSATPTSPELGTQGSSLHDKRQLNFLCLSFT